MFPIKPFELFNNNTRFYTLLSKLNSFEINDIIIDLESTTHYGDNLASFLIPKIFHIRVINLQYKPLLCGKTTFYPVQIFPALQYFFKSRIHKKTIYVILKKLPSTTRSHSVHLTHLKNLPVPNSREHFRDKLIDF